MSTGTAHRSANEAYVQRHRAAGLCAKCPEPASPGSIYGEKCRRKRRAHDLARGRARNQKRWFWGLCLSCGDDLLGDAPAAPDEDASVRCDRCRARHNESRRRCYWKHRKRSLCRVCKKTWRRVFGTNLDRVHARCTATMEVKLMVLGAVERFPVGERRLAADLGITRGELRAWLADARGHLRSALEEAKWRRRSGSTRRISGSRRRSSSSTTGAPSAS